MEFFFTFFDKIFQNREVVIENYFKTITHSKNFHRIFVISSTNFIWQTKPVRRCIFGKFSKIRSADLIFYLSIQLRI